MRIGRRIAFDVGSARIGVALSDPHGILASPREFLVRHPQLADTITAMRTVIDNEDVIEVYVGLPTNLHNQSTLSTKDAIHVAKALAEAISQPVRLIDERMSTRIASGSMREAGKNSKQQRSSIDSAAACVILEEALQFERNNGTVAGTLISEYEHGE